MKGELNFLSVKYCAAAEQWYVCRPYISVVREIEKAGTGAEMLHATTEEKRIFMTYCVHQM